jgi:hypothetical protein
MQNDEENKPKLTTPAIVGISIGSVVGAVFIFFLIYWGYKKMMKRKENANDPIYTANTDVTRYRI